MVKSDRLILTKYARNERFFRKITENGSFALYTRYNERYFEEWSSFFLASMSLFYAQK